jgi:hypothetical protein
MATTLVKEKIVVEDIELSMDSTIEQGRGTVTPFNAAYLPYTVSESVALALDNRYTSGYLDANFAKLAGDETVAFKLAPATNDNEGINLAQLNTETATLDNSKADKTNVLLKADPDGLNDGYNPANDFSPATKKYADGLIADKFLGAITGKFKAENSDGSGTIVTVTVTNGVITEIL